MRSAFTTLLALAFVAGATPFLLKAENAMALYNCVTTKDCGTGLKCLDVPPNRTVCGTCDPETSDYMSIIDGSPGTCGGIYGERCILGLCIPGYNCNNNTCGCHGGQVHDAGRCVEWISYNGTCDIDQRKECADKLTCVNGICQVLSSVDFTYAKVENISIINSSVINCANLVKLCIALGIVAIFI